MEIKIPCENVTFQNGIFFHSGLFLKRRMEEWFYMWQTRFHTSAKQYFYMENRFSIWNSGKIIMEVKAGIVKM